jgi:uncharacterized membrane protein YvbJ
MIPEVCPNCGADVPPNARACPECGACEETGWSDEASTSELGLPDEDFDYEDYVKREFREKKVAPRGISRFWWVIAVVVVIAILTFLFR